jgi:hypothetical protein
MEAFETLARAVETAAAADQGTMTLTVMTKEEEAHALANKTKQLSQEIAALREQLTAAEKEKRSNAEVEKLQKQLDEATVKEEAANKALKGFVVALNGIIKTRQDVLEKMVEEVEEENLAPVKLFFGKENRELSRLLIRWHGRIDPGLAERQGRIVAQAKLAADLFSSTHSERPSAKGEKRQPTPEKMEVSVETGVGSGLKAEYRQATRRLGAALKSYKTTLLTEIGRVSLLEQEREVLSAVSEKEGDVLLAYLSEVEEEPAGLDGRSKTERIVACIIRAICIRVFSRKKLAIDAPPLQALTYVLFIPGDTAKELPASSLNKIQQRIEEGQHASEAFAEIPLVREIFRKKKREETPPPARDPQVEERQGKDPKRHKPLPSTLPKTARWPKEIKREIKYGSSEWVKQCLREKRCLVCFGEHHRFSCPHE